MSTGLQLTMMADQVVGKNLVVHLLRARSCEVVQDPLVGAVVALVLLVDHMLASVEAWKDFADLGKET